MITDGLLPAVTQVPSLMYVRMIFYTRKLFLVARRVLAGGPGPVELVHDTSTGGAEKARRRRSWHAVLLALPAPRMVQRPSGKKAGGKKTTAAKPQPELPSSSRGDRFRAAGSGNGTHTVPRRQKPSRRGRLSSSRRRRPANGSEQCTPRRKRISRPLNACELDRSRLRRTIAG